MKIKLNLFILILLACAASSLHAQSNKIAIIDYYGQGYTQNNAASCLSFRENDTISFLFDDNLFTRSKTAIEACLLKLPFIRQAEVSFVCCNQPGEDWIVYVGTDTVKAPVGGKKKNMDVFLPKEITEKYDRLTELLVEAIQHNEADEDKSSGHSLILYEPARKIQRSFVKYADDNIKLLRSVLHTSKYPGEREIAAMVISYYSNKNDIVGDLLLAAADPESAVRNNAMHATHIIAEYSYHEKLRIPISPEPFIKLMNSVSWTDRNKSSLVLLSLTHSRNTEVLQELKSKALQSIIDMAGWKNLGHSLPGFILLGRMTGWTDQVIMSGVNNERQAQIQEMLDAMNKKPGE